MARIAERLRSSDRPGVLGGIGGFAGAFSLREGNWRDPVLVATTDGVGTKLEVARQAGDLRGVGYDLVAMCVDDLVCTGAEPLFLLDYLAVGMVEPERVADLVASIDAACVEVGCALLGGETAEHPGLLAPDQFDLAGFAVGAVERDEQLGAHRVADGDALVALASTNLRSNGYSLARHVLFELAGRALSDPAWDGATETVAEVLLSPSVLFAPHVRRALAQHPGAIHAAAHVTGGGIAANLARVLPEHLDADVDRSGIAVPPIFAELQRLGGIEDARDGPRVQPRGRAWSLVVEPERADAVVATIAAGGIGAVRAGVVHPGRGAVVVR